MATETKKVAHTPFWDTKGNLLARLAPPGRVYKTTTPKMNLVVFDQEHCSPTKQLLGTLITVALNTWKHNNAQVCFHLKEKTSGVYQVTATVKRHGDKVAYPETLGGKHPGEIWEGQTIYNKMVLQTLVNDSLNCLQERAEGIVHVDRLKEKFSIKEYMLNFND